MIRSGGSIGRRIRWPVIRGRQTCAMGRPLRSRLCQTRSIRLVIFASCLLFEQGSSSHSHTSTRGRPLTLILRAWRLDPGCVRIFGLIANQEILSHCVVFWIQNAAATGFQYWICVASQTHRNRHLLLTNLRMMARELRASRIRAQRVGYGRGDSCQEFVHTAS